jgi:hypothetical protein
MNDIVLESVLLNGVEGALLYEGGRLNVNGRDAHENSLYGT